MVQDIGFEEIRHAVTVVHSKRSPVSARAAAHESLLLFQDSVAAWGGGLELVRGLRPNFLLYGQFGAAMLATKARRGDYVEDHTTLLVAILMALRSVSRFPLAPQREMASIRNELATAAAVLAAPAPVLFLLDSTVFQTLEPLSALLTLGQTAQEVCFDSSSSDHSFGSQARMRCETHVTLLLGPALKVAFDSGVCGMLICGVLRSVAAFAHRRHSTITLTSLAAGGALPKVGRVAIDTVGSLMSVQRIAALNLLKVAFANEPCGWSLDNTAIFSLVSITATVLDQAERDIEAPLKKATFVALGKGAAELGGALAEAATAYLATVNNIPDNNLNWAQLVALLPQLASFSCHQQVCLTRAVAPAFSSLFAAVQRAYRNFFTPIHARTLLESILERARQSFAKLNMQQHDEEPDYWLSGNMVKLTKICAKKIGIAQSLASASTLLGDADAARSDVASVVCATLAKDALDAAHTDNKLASTALDSAVSALQAQIAGATMSNSRRRAALAFRNYSGFCTLRGGDLLDITVSVLLAAATTDSVDSLAASRLKAAKTTLDTLCCVSQAASDLLSTLPSLGDRAKAAEVMHTRYFRSLRAKITADLSALRLHSAPERQLNSRSYR